MRPRSLTIANYSASDSMIESSDGIVICPFSNATTLRGLAANKPLDAVLVRIAGFQPGVEALLIEGAGWLNCPVIVSTFPSPAALDHLVRLSRSSLRLRVAIPGGVSQIRSELNELSISALPSPGEYLIQRFGSAIRADLLDIMLPILTIGVKKTAAATVEATCSRSGRSIREALRANNLPSTAHLLALVLGFGVAFNTYANNLTLNQAAAAAGFPNPLSFRRHLKALTGLGPSDWREMRLDGASSYLFHQLRGGMESD